MNIIQIPVSSHVKKYILYEYGQEPIFLTRKNKLGNLISNLIGNEAFHINKLPSRSTCNIAFKLNSRFRRSYITQEKAKKLAYFFDQEFKKAFCTFINSYVRFGIYAEEAMSDFYKLYKIEETEYSQSSMRRYFYRYGKETISKKEKKTPKNLKNIFTDDVPKNITFCSQNFNFFKTNFKPDDHFGLSRRKASEIARNRNKEVLLNP